MTISLETIKKLANLAYLDEKDAINLLPEISAAIDHVSIISQFDTKNVDPLPHPVNTHQHLRADKITEKNNLNQLAGIAPTFMEDHYLVPNVIKR